MPSVEVSEGVYAVLGKSDSIYDGWGANQGFIVTDGGVVVVDTGFTKTASENLMREIKAKTKEPIRLVVNTHDHSDHVFGNSVFALACPATISHTVCKTQLVKFGDSRMQGYRKLDARLRESINGLKITPPSATYDDDFTLRVGETEIKFIHPLNGAHTRGDTILYLPQRRVLFAGDIAWVKYHPNLEDANIPGWIGALERIDKMDVEDVVPGHGEVAGKESCRSLSEYLSRFDDKFKEMATKGDPKDRITKELLDLGESDWKLPMIVERNVEILYPRYAARPGRSRS
jgi:cyclase